MKRIVYLGVFFGTLIINIFGQSNSVSGNENWISNYENKTIWLSGNVLRDSKGNKYLISGFGVPKGLVELLKNSPSAGSDLIGYEKNHNIGMAIYWVGLGLMIGDLVWGLVDRTSAMQNIGIYAGIGGGGFVICLTSFPAILKANDHLMKAIWLYNKDATFDRLVTPKVSSWNGRVFNIASYSWAF